MSRRRRRSGSRRRWRWVPAKIYLRDMCRSASARMSLLTPA
ncbi:hypothetical protein LINGRAHAP2_LOCUS25176 [Linum grandiflorum]